MFRPRRTRCGECVTAVGISHSWDESKQMLRDPAAQPQARQSTQGIARDILVQKTVVHEVAVVRQPDGGCLDHSRAEAAVVPPLELFGKAIPFLVAGIKKGLVFPFFEPVAARRLGE